MPKRVKKRGFHRIGAIIRIGQESWCLQYAGFFSITIHLKLVCRRNVIKLLSRYIDFRKGLYLGNLHLIYIFDLLILGSLSE